MNARALTAGSRDGAVSCCSVDAGGVPAEWVEAGAAWSGQATFVLFAETGGPGFREARAMAAGLAMNTGARILVVGSRLGSAVPEHCRVEEALTAYRWLLGEGCELETTTFAFAPRADSGVELHCVCEPAS